MMDLDAAITAIEDEVRRLRREGVDGIALHPNRLDPFRADFETQASVPPTGNAQPGDAAIPPPAETGTAAGSQSRSKSPPAATQPASKVPNKPASFQIPEGLAREEQMAWLRQRVLDCPVCRDNLNSGAQIVFGTGPVDAEIFFCGEAPGAEEEQSGEPFVGPAGELLTRMIRAMGIDRSSVYIANILKWRPQTGKTIGNRPPTSEEIAFCMPYIRAQIEIVRPRVIVALGATAATALLERDEKVRIGTLRGKWDRFGETPMILTYHPSFILHNGTLQRKREIWEDLLSVMQHIGLPITEKQQSYFLAG